ncbi:MAG: type II toxin-antitoxin system HicA family toxin [Clostridia bacterium]|nr:type II toxin-antitoxin system HicA family toxin [Clostridia bacterium]
MPLTPKEMIQLLESNGFICVRQNGSHMFFKNAQTGKATTVPFHSKELKKGLEQRILKDAGLK